MTALANDYAPLTDMRASSAYRKSVARNLLYKFWLETSGSKTATQVVDFIA
jgi:xanthine dehydrogenase small subunit